jgi:hypothetical protein
MPLITRQSKGTKLSIVEMDGNLEYLEELASQGGGSVIDEVIEIEIPLDIDEAFTADDYKTPLTKKVEGHFKGFISESESESVELEDEEGFYLKLRSKTYLGQFEKPINIFYGIITLKINFELIIQEIQVSTDDENFDTVETNWTYKTINPLAQSNSVLIDYSFYYGINEVNGQIVQDLDDVFHNFVYVDLLRLERNVFMFNGDGEEIFI